MRLGLSDRADSEAVALTFDKMLEDQGVEPTEANRWVLGWANRASWEVYMCLLHSLVEDYERMRRTHPSAAFAPLDDFLQSNEGVGRRTEKPFGTSYSTRRAGLTTTPGWAAWAMRHGRWPQTCTSPLSSCRATSTNS